MKLYYHPMSSNARCARLAAVALGAKPELVLVDLQKGDNRKPDYLALNPNGKIPTLVDGDTVLWESIAIAMYLAEKTPGQTLYPTDATKRAHVNKWLFWKASHWGHAMGTLVWENMLKGMFGMGGPNEYAVTGAMQQAGALCGVLDATLAKSRFVCGDSVTLADFAIASPLMYTAPAKLPIESHANLMRWFKDIQATEAWKATEPTASNR
jgi:glutathione S-transferase